MKKIQKNLNAYFFIIICCFFFTKGSAATIYFNQVYNATTGTPYGVNTQSLTGLQLLSGYSFKVVSADPAATTFNSGNNENVILYYVNTSGIQVSVYGVISRQNKSGNTTLAVNFIVSDSTYTTFTGAAYLLVLPGKESNFSNGATASTSSDPIDPVLNAILSTQATAPIINSSVSSVSVLENAGYAVFTFSLTNPPTSNYSFTPYLTAVTAVSGVDFVNSIEYLNGSTWQAISGALTITSTALSFQLRVPIINYNTSLTNKTFNINTGPITGGGILNNYGSYGVGTILVPVISTSGTLSTFSTCSGVASAQQSFTVSGVNLVGNLIVTPPTGYEVSTTSGSGFSTSVSLTPVNNTVSTTTIYVRLTTSAINNASGNIVCSSTSAVSANVSTGTATVIPSSVGGTATATSATVCYGTGTTITLNGSTGSIQWQQSSNGTSGWSNVSGATSATLTTGNLTATNYYRALVTSSICSAATSNVVSITVNPTSVGGSITGATTVCSGTNSTILSLSGNTGSVTKWQSSTVSDFSSNVTDIVNTTTSLTTTNLTVTTYYRAVVTSGVCSAATSNVVAITVSPISVGGTATATSAAVCYGTGTTITLNGSTGSIQWQQSSNGTTGWSNVSGATSITLTTGNLTATNYYRALVTSGVCSAATSNVATITVNPTSVAGTASSNQTICSGSTASDLTLNGYTGTIQWQSSTDNTTFSNISGQTAATLAGTTIGALTATRYYRALVTSGVCASTTSNVVTITVNPNLPASVSISASATTICVGTSVTFTATPTNGGTTPSYQWKLNGNNVGANSAVFTTTTLTNNDVVSVVMTSNATPCLTGSPVTSNTITMTVRALPTITIGYIDDVSPLATSFVIPYTATTGSPNQYSIATAATGGTSIAMQNFVPVANATLPSSPITITIPQSAAAEYGFNLTITNTTTGCSAVYPFQIMITAMNHGDIGSNQTICSGDTPAPLTNITSATGAGTITYTWEQSTTSANTGYSTITSATSDTYAPGALTQTTYFKRVSHNQFGDASDSDPITITVNPTSVGGTATAALATVCAGNGTSLTLNGYTGTIQWQQSAGGATGWGDISGATSATLTTGNLIATTYYRAVVTSGVCSATTSNLAAITVNPTSVGGSLSGATTVCSGTNSTVLTLSGNTGSVTKWQSSTVSDFSSNVTDIANTTTSLTATNLTATTYYRAVVTSGVCSAATSNVATIIVISSVAGSISGEGTVCSTTPNSTVLTLTGSIGSIQWQSSSTLTGSYVDISGATSTTYTVTNLSSSTYFRALISNGSCPSEITTSVQIIVLSSNVWTGSVSPAWNNASNWSCGVPSSGDNIEIPGGLTNYPVLDGPKTIGNVILGNGATINLNNFTLTVSGTFSGTGTLIGGGTTSSLTMNGSGNQGTFYMNQTTPGTTNVVSNFTLNATSSGSATLGNAMGISGILTLTNGTFNTGGNLTLMSNGTSTAVVAPITDCSAVTINGDVTVERFFPARRAFRFISSPVTTTTTIRDNWQEGVNNPPPAYVTNLNPHPGYGTHITGNITGSYGFDITQTTNNSMFTFNNTTGVWVTVPNTNVITLTAGVPYRLLIRGDRSISMSTNNPTPTNTTLRAKGALKICDASAGTISPVANGYNFIGNPYQATVDIKQVLTQNAHFNNNYYWVWDPKINIRGGYVAYDLSTGINPVNGSQVNQYLQPWQGCFVKNDAVGGGSIMFHESDKSTSLVNENVYRNNSNTPSYIRATLYESNTLASNGVAADGLIVKFDSNYDNQVDSNDAPKMTNQDEIFSIKNNTTLLGVESRLFPVVTDIIPLNITQYRFTNYTMVLQGNNMSGLPAYLHDQLLQTYTEIPQTNSVSYSYVISSTDPATSASDRFRIVFQNPNLGLDTNNELGFSMSPNPSVQGVFDVIMNNANEDTTLTIYNAIGQEVYKTNLTTSTINHINPNKLLATGLYYVKVKKDANIATIKKLIIE